ncbi:MAG: hypothetical protein U0325_17110 [Polyangiales bacterium]
MKLPLLFVLVTLGCATAEPPPPEPSVAAAPRRRRRRPRVDADASAPAAPVDPTLPASPRVTPAAAPAGEFGSPVVAATPRAEGLRARWLDDGRVLCDGDVPAQRPSTQSPYEPTGAMIARSFEPLAEAVVACAPPRNADGNLTVRVRIAGSGLPQVGAFPEGTPEPAAQCVGRALCGLRMTAFRASFTTVPYEFALPPPPPSE